MYCPTCATQNLDDAKFCRTCGTNLSLVPHAITGQLKLPRQMRRELRRGRGDGLAHGITQAFMGLGFLMVALAIGLSRTGGGWWYWMLIPAFIFLGKGVASVVTALAQNRQKNAAAQLPSQQQPRATGEVPAPPRVEFPLPPASVTETTTRHLDPASRREPN